MPVVKIITEQGESAVAAERGTGLYALLTSHGIHIDAPCGGNCFCGKCKVRAFPPQCDTLTEAERQFLTPEELKNGVRLACAYKIEGDTTVYAEPARQARIVADSAVEIRADAGGTGYGAAIDLGTTTIVAYLYDLETGRKLGHRSAVNAQTPYGADVITRIQYTMEHPDGLQVLHQRIVEQLEQLLAGLCTDCGAPPEKFARAVVAGNTTMLHLLAGENPQTLAVSPFTPVFLGERRLDTQALGMRLKTELLLMPSISAYVGADITAGLLASKIHQAEKRMLFVDIGTNGEMALGNRDGILCCSAAAGPALEGARIACGKAGVAGAVNHFKMEGAKPVYTVIGGGPPDGICGSGVVDVVAALLDAGIIEDTGYMEEDFVIDGDVRFTPRDVREVQLAKAAVAAGIEMMCAEAGVQPEEIGACVIAGGFGSLMDCRSACRIGLIPEALLKKVQIAGNTAGAGAALYLLSEEARRECAEIIRMARCLELSGMNGFETCFTEHMFFS
ncbi:MAG TPA: DUF4445 domain-containing protein [Candidatus Avimonoglobus intestinipullorum]|uniref:DUF4445 domain-containing protein n=1 Tax=Candidatus Avimonoglobus intestinipullorum TaxID=2840699 RepID=A0A9D1S6D4_9FIRM|nr:DUF4445 domain-containing protein [Candidatus Avimonoglobus intestinipullorum]